MTNNFQINATLNDEMIFYHLQRIYHIDSNQPKAFTWLQPLIRSILYSSQNHKNLLGILHKMRKSNQGLQKKLHEPFLWIRFNCLKAVQPLLEDSLPSTTKLPRVFGAHLIKLGRANGWVDLVATLWLCHWDYMEIHPSKFIFFTKNMQKHHQSCFSGTIPCATIYPTNLWKSDLNFSVPFLLSMIFSLDSNLPLTSGDLNSRWLSS